MVRSGLLVILKNRIEISVLPVPDRFDLPGFYAARGHAVLLGAPRPDPVRRGFSIAPLTCVTVAKRLLGVSAPWVLAWQLYLHLKADGFHHVDTSLPWHRLAAPVRPSRAIGT